MSKKPLIIGLTGGIGMGKSTAAKILRGFGLPVYNADDAVHALLHRGGKAVKSVTKLFPESLQRGSINRKILGQFVFGKPRKLKQLEDILHPLVRQQEKIFVQQARKNGAKAVILEIPLLFETGGDARCDVVLCVTAPASVQKARVLQRPGMTEARLKQIKKHQMPDAEKRRCADFVVQTGGGYAATKKQLKQIITGIL